MGYHGRAAALDAMTKLKTSRLALHRGMAVAVSGNPMYRASSIRLVAAEQQKQSGTRQLRCWCCKNGRRAAAFGRGVEWNDDVYTQLQQEVHLGDGDRPRLMLR